MLRRDEVEIIFRSVAAQPVRAGLTMLGILVAVAAIILILAAGTGAQHRIAEQLRSLGTRQLLVLPGAATSGGASLGIGTRRTLTEADAEAIRRELPDAIAIAPAVGRRMQAVHEN